LVGIVLGITAEYQASSHPPSGLLWRSRQVGSSCAMELMKAIMKRVFYAPTRKKLQAKF
jgi:hypothetical protein